MKTIIFLAALLTGCGDLPLKLLNEEDAFTVKAVPEGADYIMKPIALSLYASDETAVIHYALKGELPDVTSPIFNPDEPIMIDATTQIRFFAVAGKKASNVKVEIYRFAEMDNK